MPGTSAPLEVILYTRAGCHLCEEAKQAMAPVLRECGARLREVDIDADPQLRQQYNEEVPVVFVGNRKIAKYRVDPERLRRALTAL